METNLCYVSGDCRGFAYRAQRVEHDRLCLYLWYYRNITQQTVGTFVMSWHKFSSITLDVHIIFLSKVCTYCDDRRHFFQYLSKNTQLQQRHKQERMIFAKILMCPSTRKTRAVLVVRRNILDLYCHGYVGGVASQKQHANTSASVVANIEHDCIYTLSVLVYEVSASRSLLKLWCSRIKSFETVFWIAQHATVTFPLTRAFLRALAS